MTDLDRNMRTLIVCFVLALVGLVPLRLMQGNIETVSEVQVLGETDELRIDGSRTKEIYDTNEDYVAKVNEIVLPEVGGEE